MKSIALFLILFGFVTATIPQKKTLAELQASHRSFQQEANSNIVEFDSLNKKILYEIDSTRTDNWGN